MKRIFLLLSFFTLCSLQIESAHATGVTTCGRTSDGTNDSVLLDSPSGASGQRGVICAAQRVQHFLSGDLARAIVLIAIVVCGGMWMMNRQGQNAQTLGRIAIGAVLIFLASPIFQILGIGGAGI